MVRSPFHFVGPETKLHANVGVTIIRISSLARRDPGSEQTREKIL